MLEKVKEDLSTYKFVIIAVIVYIVIMQLLFNQICPIKIIFKMDCPGCGITHATYYIFTGQFQKAIETNWTAFLWIFLAIVFILERYILSHKIKITPYVFIGVCILTIVRYVLTFIYR